MAKTAVRPDFLSYPILAKKNEELDKRGVTDDERFLYGMSQTSGWPIFTKKKEELFQALDQIQEKAMETASFEQLGQNALIINQVKGLVNRLWSVIDDAKEACEGAGT